MSQESPQLSGLELAPGVRVAPGLVETAFTASAGPGGQNVNKRATRCQLRIALADLPVAPEVRQRLTHLAPHLVTASGDLLIECDEHRSQGQNRDGCFERLRELLVAASRRPKIRRPTKPTRGSKERRIDSKKRRSQTKRRRGERPED